MSKRKQSKAVAPTSAAPPSSAVAPGLIMVIDTSEPVGTAYSFDDLCPSIRRSLVWGDYAIAGFESSWVCERKQIDDLFGTLFGMEQRKGRKQWRRDRFERELAALRSYEYAAIIIEGTKRDVLDYRPSEAAAKEGAWASLSEAQKAGRCRGAINVLHRYEIEYGVRVHYVDKDRDFCRSTVFRLAEQYWRLKRGKGDVPDPSPLPVSSSSPPSPSSSGSEAPAV